MVKSTLVKSALALSLICFTSLSPNKLHAEIPIIEVYENKKVASIEIVPENLPQNASFDAKTVLNRLKTQVELPFSQLTFDADLKTLASEYDRVEPHIEVQKGEVHITIKVWPKPVIRLLKWEGNERFSSKKLGKELGIKPLTLFNRLAFNKAIGKIKELYIKKGFFEAQIQYSIENDPKTNEVEITVSIKEGRSGIIDDIVFNGFTSQEISQLLNMIHTKKHNLFLSWILGTGQYNEDALEQDKMTIVSFLQDRGYADARVQIYLLDAPTPGKVIIEIHADKGTIYHFGKVTFDGNHIISNKEIEASFIARPKSVYSPEKLRETVQVIKDLYGRKGYIEASVHYETRLIENAPLYNVHFQIDEGGQYKVGMIHIIGNIHTQNHVILRESLLIPGEVFDSAKLEATQARLENMGYFKSVNVYSVRTAEDESLGPDFRDVYIEVQETTTGNIALFFGASTTDKVFGGLDLSESNFNSKGFGKLFTQGPRALRGGGEYAHIRVTLGKSQQNFSLSWLNPYFNDSFWRVGFDVSKATSGLISSDYTIDTIGGTIYASYPIAPFFSFGMKYRLRHTDVHVSHHAPQDARDQEDNSGLLSGFGTSLSFDSTDSALKPHRGLRSSVEAEYTGLGGDFDFYRFSYANTLYTPLWSKGTMKYRYDFRFILPSGDTDNPNDIPLSERYFLGGETSVRGYRSYDIGPNFSNDDPSGGISASLLSIEYNQEILKILDVFLFADAGAVSLKRFKIKKYNLSYGIGARVDLMGKLPFLVGYGFPVNPDRKSQVDNFFFSMGGQF